MRASELKEILAEVGITQADFAQLIGITARAVSLWATEQRPIPGPTDAYLRVLRSLPANLRQVELNRLKQKGTNMRDGIYRISFQGQQSQGTGMLIFDSGRIYGADEGGVKYDGEYIFNETSGQADVKIKVTFPPNVKSVFGVSNPYEWAFDVTTTLDPHCDSGSLAVKTSIGRPIKAHFAFLRSLPEAA